MLPVTTALLVDEVGPEQDLDHVHDVLGPLPGRGHAHEGLVRVGHRRVRDPQVAMADRHIHRLADHVRARMQARRLVCELVEVVEVGDRSVAALVLEVADERRAGHGHEDGRVAAELDRLLRVARVQLDAPRHGLQAFLDHLARDAHALAVDLGAGLAPVLQCNRVAEIDAGGLEDPHRGVVDALHALGVDDLDGRHVALQPGQHRLPLVGPRLPARAASPTPAASDLDVVAHYRSPRHCRRATAATAARPASVYMLYTKTATASWEYPRGISSKPEISSARESNSCRSDSSAPAGSRGAWSPARPDRAIRSS
ncbi:MAG: hypothetical protein U5K33_00250 [Halofilum sp. (in: g-proteobacteria)]|nr:hypothetical protein [Halofilum sp. (in: g-proteobacteria)]